ncbi:MAG: hypothetical protein QM765_42260 [Myxococcales bacterium]
MLSGYIKKALELGANALEVEYKDRQEQICAMRGPMGVSIGSVPSNSKESAQLYDEIEALQKAKKIEIGSVVFRATVEEFDSFGETAHRIQLAKAKSR